LPWPLRSSIFCWTPVHQVMGMDNSEASQTDKPRIREARLKPEFSHLYPALEPNRWEPAARMADRMVAWLLRQPDRGYVAPNRVLRSEHFEFRGGSEKPESTTWQPRRSA
jgi:hypothetical protein